MRTSIALSFLILAINVGLGSIALAEPKADKNTQPKNSFPVCPKGKKHAHLEFKASPKISWIVEQCAPKDDSSWMYFLQKNDKALAPRAFYEIENPSFYEAVMVRLANRNSAVFLLVFNSGFSGQHIYLIDPVSSTTAPLAKWESDSEVQIEFMHNGKGDTEPDPQKSYDAIQLKYEVDGKVKTPVWKST